MLLVGQRLGQAHARREPAVFHDGRRGVDGAGGDRAGCGTARADGATDGSVVTAALPPELWLAVMQCVRRSEMVGTLLDGAKHTKGGSPDSSPGSDPAGHGKRRPRRSKRRPSESDNVQVGHGDGDHDV